MKKSLTAIIVFLTLVSSGQDYKLFREGSKKLYSYYPTAGLSSGIEFDSVIISGSDSVYYTYTGIGNEIESDTCVFWGGTYCSRQDRPLWFGPRIISNNDGIYRFITDFADTLSFSFDILPGDSALFYEDVSQQFYMIYEDADTSTILGIPDSARFYRVAHYDGSGNIINSPLNDEMIIVGRDMGLANFFRIDSFPLVLQPLSLIGNLAPTAGLVSLTNGMVYDHQSGDEIQYLDQYYMLGGPPFYNYTNYIKHIFLERSDTEDSIIYTVERITYKTDSNLLIQDTIIIRYERNRGIAEIPFDKLNQETALVITKLYAGDYCDLKLWTYRLRPGYLVYCPADNCWGIYDIPGPPPNEETIYACGLGIYLDRSSVSMPPPEGYSYINKIIYFKKDGVECGEEIIVNVNEHEVQHSGFTVYPNPAKDMLYISNGKDMAGTIQLSDLTGRQLIRKSATGQLIQLDISGLAEGIYLVSLINDSSVEVKKIMINN